MNKLGLKIRRMFQSNRELKLLNNVPEEVMVANDLICSKMDQFVWKRLSGRGWPWRGQALTPNVLYRPMFLGKLKCYFLIKWYIRVSISRRPFFFFFWVTPSCSGTDRQANSQTPRKVPCTEQLHFKTHKRHSSLAESGMVLRCPERMKLSLKTKIIEDKSTTHVKVLGLL